MLQDYENIYPYKLGFFLFFATIWSLSLFSIINHPTHLLLKQISKYYFYMMIVRLLVFFGHSLRNFLNCKKLLKRIKQKQKLQIQRYHSEIQGYIHAFVIPSYQEDLNIFYQTLDFLSSHDKANQKYAIFLAMEQRERNCQHKAQKLIQKYQNKFKLITYTVHQLLEHEQQGKASNVSHCCQQISSYLTQKNIQVTIIDVDSLIPNAYIEQMEYFLSEHYDERNKYIFSAFQTFNRNNLDVPIFTRIQDQNHALCNYNFTLPSFNGIGFPLSNYTISLQTLKNINFSDTVPEAIGEDYHTTLKAFWKLNGQIEVVTIYTMISQLCVQTGNGYLEDIKARFWQAERHARGISSLIYAVKQFFQKPLRPRTLYISFILVENICGYVFFYISLCLKIGGYFEQNEQQQSSILIPIMAITYFCQYILYLLIKNETTATIYRYKSQSLFHLAKQFIQFCLIYNINFIFFFQIPSFIAILSILTTTKRQYVVAQKKIKNQ